jgi:DNA modification methylase
MQFPSVSFRPVAELAAYGRNARQHSPQQIEQIAVSIREFGWTLPVLADANGIVAGHARVAAAQLLYEAGERIRLPNGELVPDGTVPVLDCTGWTTAQRRAYVLADNRLAESATWDAEILAEELSNLLDMGFDVELLGFEADDLEALRPDEVIADLLDADEAPEPPAMPVTRPGDLWQLGEHRLLCGDALDAGAMRRLLAGGVADLVITDPPYNVAYEGKTAKRMHIANDDMSEGAFGQFLLSAYRNIAAGSKPGASIYVFHADTEGMAFRRAFEAAGLKLAQCCVWVKQSFVLGRSDYHWQHEPVLYGWKPGAAHVWHGDRSQSTVWAFDRPSRSEEHPTMKPVALLAYLIGNSSRAGDVVLDPFAGSGSTLMACEATGRQARVIELDMRFCDVILRRWMAATGLDATLADDGRTFDEVAENRPAGEPEPTADVPPPRARGALAAVKNWLSRRLRRK